MENDRMPQTIEELRAFVDERVRKALEGIVRDTRIHSGPRAYAPPRMEVKDAAIAGKLPAWARHEEGVGGQGE